MEANNLELQRLELTFPGFANATLWKPNCFRGDAMHQFANPKSNVQSADICTRLMKLKELGIIESRNFNPSPTVRALLGLRGSRIVKEPDIETAHGFDWEVVDGSIGRRLIALNNPATQLGEMF